MKINMKELIDPKMAERVLLLLAIAGPLLGLIIGTFLGAHEERARPKMIAGTLLGALGSLIYGMWRIYGIITDKLGLDSLMNLGLQLIMFAVLGVVLGVVIFKISVLLKRPWAGR